MALCANPTATKHRVRRIEQLIQDPDVDINCVDRNGNNALLLLCRMNRCDDLYACVQILLRGHQSVDGHKRIDVNHQNLQGWNALLLLCRYHTDENLIDLFHLLIQHGISLRTKANNWTALLLLSRHYNNENLLEIAKLYLKHNQGYINCRTDFGTNCLGLLCRYYNCKNLPDIVKLYINHGIDVNCKNNDRRSALVILCRFRGSDNVVDCIRLLIESGADINCADYEGWNTLHFLCRHYSRDNLIGIVCLVTQRCPAVLRCITKSGITALEALSRNWTGMFHSLLNKLSEDVHFDDQSLGRIAVNTSLLGCFNSVWALLLRLGSVPVDSDFKDPFDYLEDVTNQSFTLCNEPMCRSVTIQEIDDVRKEFKLARRFSLETVWKKKIFKNKITYNDQSTYRHDGRPRHISLPSYNEWLQLCSAWHDDNTVTIEMIDNYLSKHSHPPGSNHSSCNWCLVTQDVDNYIYRLLDKIKEIDPLFGTKKFDKYGSSTEKTDVFLPSESDRLVVLKHFRQSPTNRKEVVYAGTCHQTDSPLTTYEPINSSSLLLRMTELMKAAADSVSSVHVFGPIVGYSETCVTIHFLYRGRFPPAIKASVDITVAVEIVEPTTDVLLPAWCCMPRNLPAFLVPFRRAEGSRWQTSFSTVERDLILKGGDCVAKVYQMLKFLVALHHAKQDRKKEIPRKVCPSSYALKTCLLRYMMSRPPPWQPDDAIHHAIGVLKTYPMHSSEMTSFFHKEHVIYEVSQKSKNFVSEIINKLMGLITLAITN